MPVFLLFLAPHRQFTIQTFNPYDQVLLAGNLYARSEELYLVILRKRGSPMILSRVPDMKGKSVQLQGEVGEGGGSCPRSGNVSCCR